MGGASGHSVTEAQSRHYMDGIVANGLNKLNYTCVAVASFARSNPLADSFCLSLTLCRYFIVDEPCFIGRDAAGALVRPFLWRVSLFSFAQFSLAFLLNFLLYSD